MDEDHDGTAGCCFGSPDVEREIILTAFASRADQRDDVDRRKILDPMWRAWASLARVALAGPRFNGLRLPESVLADGWCRIRYAKEATAAVLGGSADDTSFGPTSYRGRA